MRRLNLEVNKNMESMIVNDDYLFYKATERTHLLEIFSQIVTAFSTIAQVIYRDVRALIGRGLSHISL